MRRAFLFGGLFYFLVVGEVVKMLSAFYAFLIAGGLQFFR